MDGRPVEEPRIAKREARENLADRPILALIQLRSRFDPASIRASIPRRCRIGKRDARGPAESRPVSARRRGPTRRRRAGDAPNLRPARRSEPERANIRRPAPKRGFRDAEIR
ncbi:hypothetical protein [Burkholderia sp. ABCPW 111]|nr:hypothetical protein [Burkholderia sp. ABCPW 111]